MDRFMMLPLVVVFAALAAPAAAQTSLQDASGRLLAQEEPDDTVEYGSRVKIDVRRRGFLGRVRSEFTQQDDVPEGTPACMEGRTIELSMRRENGGLKRIGSARTDGDGHWNIRTEVRKNRLYVVKLLSQTFLYSPYYGRLEQAVCLGDKSKILPARVLGTRLARGQAEAGGALPRTGADPVLHWLGLAILLIASGAVLVTRQDEQRAQE